MSSSPCYPEPYDWGSPIVPRHPVGWYKPIYQAMDAMGKPRIYPSTLMQCLGRTERGDRIDAFEFYAILDFLYGSRAWHPYKENNNIYYWPTCVAAYLALHNDPFPGAGYWDVMWTTHPDPSYAGGIRLRQWRIEAPNTTTDVLTGATYPYNAAPWSNDPVIWRACGVQKGLPWGDPWDNPV